MKTIFALSLTLLCLSIEAAQPKIQIALLLDTSNSMDGLIDQAKTRLWNLVNEMALAEKHGRTPSFEVALYEYGKSSIPAEQGHLARLLPLTTDLDAVSEALFSLRTNGGDEYCGQVIREAAQDLAWSEDHGDFKAIFIAGNEAFDQGAVSYKTWCRKAIAKGIVVNTIFCGDEAEGIVTHWKDGADLADGRFLVIDQNQAVAAVKAPQDTAILKLGEQLNATYLGYGQMGKSARKRQLDQDKNAAGASREAAVQRTMAKASKVYKTKKWDLVSATEEGEVELEELDDEALPEAMRDMDNDGRKKFIAEKSEERKKIQTEITQLKKERARFVATQAKASRTTLDAAMEEAVQIQLKKAGFEKKGDQ